VNTVGLDFDVYIVGTHESHILCAVAGVEVRVAYRLESQTVLEPECGGFRVGCLQRYVILF